MHAITRTNIVAYTVDGALYRALYRYISCIIVLSIDYYNVFIIVKLKLKHGM
jgi:hypothetical protein